MTHRPATAAIMSDLVIAFAATHPMMSIIMGKPYPNIMEAIGLLPPLTYTMSPTATWLLGETRASTAISFRSDVPQVAAA